MGNTLNTRGRPGTAPVHPHVRGEHRTAAQMNVRANGPSPRAWGTLTNIGNGWHPHRSIPTCVGNTNYHEPRCPLRPVHPHVRGEHHHSKASPKRSNGPSPRAWGTPPAAPVGAPPVRSIPTCVGNTAVAVVFDVVKTVHPHVRGEHRVANSQPNTRNGPSPRAWGTPGGDV